MATLVRWWLPYEMMSHCLLRDIRDRWHMGLRTLAGVLVLPLDEGLVDDYLFLRAIDVGEVAF